MMLSCEFCEGRAFATEHALATHREARHQDEALLGHVYRPSVGGDLNSPCRICGMPRNATRHDRRPNRGASWER